MGDTREIAEFLRDQITEQYEQHVRRYLLYTKNVDGHSRRLHHPASMQLQETQQCK